MISVRDANKAALAIWECTVHVLRSRGSDDTLSAFAYSGNSIERWLVCETYAELWRRWDTVVPKGKAWDGWMEVALPGQVKPREHIDLVLGEVEPMPPPKSMYFQPKRWTPSIEFKILRDDDWRDGRKAIDKDAAKLSRAGLRNKYAFVAFRSMGLLAYPDLRQRLLDVAPDLVSLGPAFGPVESRIELPNRPARSVIIHVEPFRITRP